MFWFIILTSNFHFEIHGMIGLQTLVAKFGDLINILSFFITYNT
jgi:hypothetical protein